MVKELLKSEFFRLSPVLSIEGYFQGTYRSKISLDTVAICDHFTIGQIDTLSKETVAISLREVELLYLAGVPAKETELSERCLVCSLHSGV